MWLVYLLSLARAASPPLNILYVATAPCVVLGVEQIMEFGVQWSLEAESINVSDLSRATGRSSEYVRQMYRTGSLGPAPDVSAQVQKVPLYHVSALFVLEEVRALGVATDRAMPMLPSIAGATYIGFASREIAAGRCVQRAGTPKLNTQLWMGLLSGRADADLQRALPGGPVKAQRFAVFSKHRDFVTDDLPTKI